MANQLQVQQFLNKVIPMCMEDMRKTGILASLSIAQSCIESSYGLSGLTVSASNLFGVKGSYNGQSYNCMGFEEIKGKRVNQMITWKKYPSWQESINDHSALFLKYDRYKNLRGCTDYKQACINVRADGYCTSSTYSQLLIEIIESHQLYKYDQQVLASIIPQTTPVVNILPTPNPTSHQIGQQVTVASFATQWETGENIPSFIRGKKYFIKQVDTVKARVLIAPSMTGAVTGWLRFQDIQ